jgi:tryptophan synthase alpha chain
MGYFNPFYQYGIDALLKKAKEIGISGMIIPDLPHEEAVAYKAQFDANAISNISFVAPTDDDARIKEVVSDAKKFIYLVAYAGITGSGQSEDLQPIITSIKSHTETPVYVGFGVNEKTAKEKVTGADGVIVGSAFVNVLLQEDLSLSQKIDRCCAFWYLPYSRHCPGKCHQSLSRVSGGCCKDRRGRRESVYHQTSR